MPAAPIRVYLVEDDDETRGRFDAALQADPRILLAGSAASGKAALFALATVKPDVLLVDLGLPDMEGREVIRFAAERLPGCETMVITVFGDEAHVLSSIEAGAKGYILKDSGGEAIVGHVLELRAGGSPISPVIARRLLRRLRHDGTQPLSAAGDAGLTTREIEVLTLISRGMTYAEIGTKLGISPNTVKSHVKGCYGKLSVASAAAAVRRAGEIGLLRGGGSSGERT
jgi:DNA-binding NarL/FixJ family response regulator